MSKFKETVLQQVTRRQLDNSQLNDAQKEKTLQVIERLDLAITSYDEQKAHILADGDLSPNGQTSKIAQLAATTAESIERIVNTDLESLSNRVLELEAELTPQPPSTDKAVEFLAQREIRDMLREVDALEIVALYQTLAIDGTDDLTMRAIEEAPASFPLITDLSIIEAGKRGRAERHSPENAELLRQMNQRKAMLTSAKNSALAHIGMTNDPILKMAVGE